MSTLEKTFIKVEWKDTPDNFNKTKEKEIEKRIAKKYGTDKVKVVPTPISNKTSEEVSDVRADASQDIRQPEYQRQLMLKYIEENDISVNWDMLTKLDDNINKQLEENEQGLGSNYEINLKYLTLKNFLSFADSEQSINFDSIHGLTAVISNPENYAGKTILIVDAFFFLFFGETTRTNSYNEIFNKYTDGSEVSCSGRFESNGYTYHVTRKLKKKFKKQGKNAGSYDISQQIDFSYEDENGWISLNGKTPQDTTKKIKEIVGNKEDFLTTIITTANNLESLIDSKPTERGKIFTRFIGLDLLREKESLCKTKYKEWYNKSYLSLYDKETLKQRKENLNETIDYERKLIETKNEELETIDSKIKYYKEIKENYETDKYPIDNDLIEVNRDFIVENIEKLKESIEKYQTEIDDKKQNLAEPENLPNADRIEELKKEEEKKMEEKSTINANIQNYRNQIQGLERGEYCPTCNQPLADHTEEIRALKDVLEKEEKNLLDISSTLSEIRSNVQILERDKEIYEEYQKNKVFIDKKEAEKQKLENNLEKGQEKLERYDRNIEKIEKNREIEQKIVSSNSALDDLNKQRETALLEINTKQSTINQKNKEFQQTDEILKSIEKDKKIDKTFQTHLEMFGKNGIGKMVLGTMIPIINSYLKQFLDDCAEFNLEVSLSEKDEIEFYMIDKENEGHYQPLRMGSGYEKTVSSLALRCVLSKICALPQPNITVFDEPFGKVGQKDNLPKLESLFYHMKDYFKNIFILTHNETVQNWANNKLIIKKTHDVSYIDY
mgnify:CR=1 FL=1